ncbi:hypothetical protein IAU60_002686 [Kwoniella sp. DSM 27419]
MRIHELLERCVEYIALDGVIGSDPARLFQHLVELDPTLDQDYFAHLWTLLCDHPSVEIILTTEPIVIPGGTTDLGTEPVPEGWEPPRDDAGNVDLDALYKQGIRGRQLAFMLSGDVYRTDKQAVQDKRESLQKKAIAKKSKAVSKGKGKKTDAAAGDGQDDDEIKEEPGTAGLLRVLEMDDSEDGVGTNIVPKTSLDALWKKWGARLRIRCTEHEVYYRLTGSHQKINKLTGTVLHILQLAAMSREKGITAIDLGPMVGASQGSTHYYMKVLVNMGLCAKVPAVLHAAITNLLVFHRFLDKNPNYRALVGRPMTEAEMISPALRLPAELNAPMDIDDDSPEDLVTETAQDPSTTDLTSFAGWGFNFEPLSETELMAGHIVRARLLMVLDHPGLQNHLLRTMNLLSPLGWTGQVSMRHRRAVKKVIETLIFEGIVERLAVGESKTDCIRLTKYGSEQSASADTQQTSFVEQSSNIVKSDSHDLQEILRQPPYMLLGGIPLNFTFEYHMIHLVVASGSEGVTINDLWAKSSHIFKRAFDYAISRSDNAPIPYHLWPRAISTFMETVGKERRLRLFSTAAYQDIMVASGQELKGFPALARPATASQWNDLTNQKFYSTRDELWLRLGSKQFNNTAIRAKPGRPLGSKSKATIARAASEVSARASKVKTSKDVYDNDEDDQSKRDFKYAIPGQTRGRPRKYIHCVELSGKINRRIIGSIYSRPDIPPILIYVGDLNLIVPAPEGYNGVGAPPPITQEQIEQGKPPKYYYQFPTHVPAAFSGQKANKSKNKGKGSNDNKQKGSLGEKEDLQDKASKRKVKDITGPSDDVTPEANQGVLRQSKRPRKQTSYAEVPLGEEDEVEPIEMDDSGSKPATATPRSLPANSTDSYAELQDSPLQSYRPVRSNESPPTRDKHSSASTSAVSCCIEATDVESDAHRAMVGTGSVVPLAPVTPSVTIPSSDLSTVHGALAAPPLPTVEEYLDAPVARRRGMPRKADTVKEPAALATSTFKRGQTRDSRMVEGSDTKAPPKVTSDVTGQSLKLSFGKTRKGSCKGQPWKTGQATIAADPANTHDSHTDDDQYTLDLGPEGEVPYVTMESSISGVLEELADAGIRPRTPEASPREGNHAIDDRSGGTAEQPHDVFVESKNESTTRAGAGSSAGPLSDIPHLRASRPAAPLADNARTTISSAQPSAVTSQPGPWPTTPVRAAQIGTPSQPTSQPLWSPRGATALHEHAKSVKGKRLQELAGSCELIRPVRRILLISGPTANNGRVDLGNIRRANELEQVLIDNGGVMADTKLIHEHRKWTYKYAGSDHPHAPAIAYGMDRQIVRKTINVLLKENRVKETIVTTPTPTGRWVKSTVIFLADLPPDSLQAYIRQLSSSTTQAMSTPQKDIVLRTSLPDTPFTQMKSGNTPKSGSKIVTNLTPRRQGQGDHERPYSERRETLLKDIKVVAQLYGWRQGRCVRLQTLHRAILRATCKADSTSVLSTSPRVFALPLLTEEITASDWFAMIMTLQYSEDIERYMQEPATASTKIKDVPRHFRPPGGFAGHSTKGKLITMLQLLTTLKIISPVTPVSPDEADFFANDSQAEGFKVNESGSIYYVLHDFVPIYQLASTPAPLLGILPARNEEEVDKLWQTFKRVSLDQRVEPKEWSTHHVKPSVLPMTGKVTDVIDMAGDQRKLFCQKSRWTNDVHLAPVQRSAFENVVNSQTGELNIATRQQIEDFAYENALPVSFVESELKRRSAEVVKRQHMIVERQSQVATKVKERQDKVQLAIREKLLERQETTRKEWEERVKAAAEKLGVSFEQGLLTFVSKHTLFANSTHGMSAVKPVLDYWIKLWDSTQDLTDDQREVLVRSRNRRPHVKNRDSAGIGSEVAATDQSGRKTRGKQGRCNGHTRVNRLIPGKDVLRRRKRSTKKWTHEDDDLYLDMEAIIRARSRSSGYRGRKAMEQFYDGISPQTSLMRIKKILAQPGKQAYYDRLEQAWYELWQQVRGSDELEDRNPESPVDFDLRQHVDFLRARIDKRSLRLLAQAIPMEEEDPAPDLPEDISQLLKNQQWSYIKMEEHPFEAVTDALSAEEIRIDAITAVSVYDQAEIITGIDPSTRDLAMLQAALKMIVGSPSSHYDPADGSALLSTWKPEVYESVIESMVEKNVLKRQTTSASTAGRFYDFSNQWEQLNDGALPAEVTEGSSVLASKVDSRRGMKWPLIGDSGELAALMGMVSNHEVEFDFAIAEFPTIKYESGHYNTRKLDDDAYEFDMRIKHTVPSRERLRPMPPGLDRCKPMSDWPFAVLDCEEDVQRIGRLVVSLVEESGPEGITKAQLAAEIGCSESALGLALAAVARQDTQGVFWAGYDTARLVPVSQWETWTVPTRIREASETDWTRSTPRRWCDLYGALMREDWERAVRAVKTQIMTRPGISLHYLRSKLNIILDRLEVVDVLEALISAGQIRYQWASEEDQGEVLPAVEAIDVAEEERVAWFPCAEAL